MSNDKHTPGPWEVDHKRTIFPQGQRSLSIAVAEQHRPECEANARLIAAGPDLLAALQEMLGMFGGAEPGDDEAHAVLDRAIAAIAKAEGTNV